MRRPRDWRWLGLRPRYINEAETKLYLDALALWLAAADLWFERQPEQARALEAWESEHITGDATYGTWDWPGWASSPSGPPPRPRDFIGTGGEP